MASEQLSLYVANLDCEHDANALERGLSGVPGVLGLSVFPKSAKVIVTYDPDSTSSQALVDQLKSNGFPPVPGRRVPAPAAPWRNPKVLTSVTAGVLLLVSWLLSMAGVSSTVTNGCYIVAIVVGGYYFGREAIEGAIFDRRIGIEFLMATAAVAAAALGEVGEGAMLVFLYSISEAAEGYTEAKTRSAIQALMDLTPKRALVRRDGEEIEIPAEEVMVGDVFIVKPGLSFVTDGVVILGRSSVNQAPVTGESVPVEKAVDSSVFAGSINGEGVLEIQATKTFADNSIARIITMVEEAQEQKGTSQRFIERFGSRYSPAVLAAGILLAIIPPLVTGGSWTEWVARATVFIVAAAPCALVISIPITMVAALGTGARQGVLIKGGIYVEELAKVTVVALDKTGTLTSGTPEVTDLVPLQSEVGTTTLLAVAAGIEQRSAHPLAQAIVRYAIEAGAPPAPVTDMQSVTGAGAQGDYQGARIFIGSPDLFRDRLGLGLADAEDTIRDLQNAGKTVVLIGTDRQVWALLALRDTIRANAAAAVTALRTHGIQRIVMLTGDNARTAAAIGRELGVDDVFADLRPEDKAIRVRELAATYGHVAMVGDGVNDAPALAAATVGVAMGAAGTDVALETADVALMADDLEKLVTALQLARRAQSVVRQNLALATVVVAVLVIGAVGGFFTLPVAVLAHEISEFVVIGSGLRLLRA